MAPQADWGHNKKLGGFLDTGKKKRGGVAPMHAKGRGNEKTAEKKVRQDLSLPVKVREREGKIGTRGKQEDLRTLPRQPNGTPVSTKSE